MVKDKNTYEGINRDSEWTYHVTATEGYLDVVIKHDNEIMGAVKVQTGTDWREERMPCIDIPEVQIPLDNGSGYITVTS